MNVSKSPLLRNLRTITFGFRGSPYWGGRCGVVKTGGSYPRIREGDGPPEPIGEAIACSRRK